MSSLVYVDDSQPHIRRAPVDQGFAYFSDNHQPVTSAEQLQRIARLAIPPVYKDVWICPDHPRGHRQATGRDAQGRKQYRYHLDWRRSRSDDKFGRMAGFGRALPSARRRVTADLKSAHGAPRRTTVPALLVRLLDAMAERVGNAKYARDNRPFGLTTLRSRHASLQGSRLRLRFRDKSGVLHEVALADSAGRAHRAALPGLARPAVVSVPGRGRGDPRDRLG